MHCIHQPKQRGLSDKFSKKILYSKYTSLKRVTIDWNGNIVH